MNMRKLCIGVSVVAFWLLLWHILSVFIASEFLLPSPMLTLKRLFTLMQDIRFFQSTILSLLRIMAGYLLALAAGVLLGALTAVSRFADTLLRPFRSIIKAMPVASFILLVLLWMRSQIAPAFTAFLMVLPIIWTNVQEGIRATDPQLIEMAKLFHFSRKKIILHIFYPSVLPYLLPACATGLGFAWKSGVAAEVLARTSNSIGKELVESKNYLETADMFAWTAIVILLSILLERLFMRFMRRVRVGERWGEKL